MAKDGDITAIRVCMDRLASVRRKDPIAFELPPVDKARDASAAIAAVISAVGAGELTTGEAAETAKLVDSYVRALEATDFEERLERLEAARKTPALPRPEPAFDPITTAAGR